MHFDCFVFFYLAYLFCFCYIYVCYRIKFLITFQDICTRYCISQNSLMEFERSCVAVGAYRFYSCRWNGRELYERSTSKISEKVFLVIAVLSYLMCTSWLYCWSILGDDSDDINQFIFEQIKGWFQWYILILVLSILCALYGLFVTISGLFHGLLTQPLYLSICHKVMIIVCLIFPIAAYVFIGSYWPDKNDQWDSISVSFVMSSPFLQICSLILWILFAIFIGFYFRRITSRFAKMLIIGAYLSFLLFLLALPIWLHSPCIGHKEKSYDLTKPHIIGHRGAPTLAPENTILSYEKALSCKVYGLESDVRFSRDGVPFLMHDTTLFRTTNVSDVFPSRKFDRADSFSWDELQLLNAGEWYLRTDPFLTNKHLSKADKTAIRLQKIPSLAQWASFAAKNNKSIIFDLFRPPFGHANHNDWANVTIKILLGSGIPQRNVLWLLSSGEHLDVIRDLAPGFRIVTSEVVNNGFLYGIQVFNLLFSRTTQEIVGMNYSVISYTVDTNWAFSRSWCQNVWAVTSSHCPLLNSMSEPSWSLTKSEYLGIWISIDIVSVIMLACIYFFFYRKSCANHIENVALVNGSELSSLSLSL